MRASFLLLLCFVLLATATATFANEAKSDAVLVYKQSKKLTGEADRVKRGSSLPGISIGPWWRGSWRY
ncbi:hypothetical protein LSAT2_011956 [Lamellibrachia satsuma]|nr:hypothetical protein LSAT2_011956 [Lamellibrachia satsuma]